MESVFWQKTVRPGRFDVQLQSECVVGNGQYTSESLPQLRESFRRDSWLPERLSEEVEQYKTLGFVEVPTPTVENKCSICLSVLCQI